MLDLKRRDNARRPVSSFVVSTLVVLILLSPLAMAAAPSNERIVSLPSLTGTAPSSLTWSPDSERVAFLWNDEGMPFRDVWVVDAEGSHLKRLTRLAPKNAPKPEPGLSREALAGRIKERAQSGVSSLLWSTDSERILYLNRGRLFSVPAEGGESERVLAGDAGRTGFSFSPAGGQLGFIEGNDLWIHDFGRGQRRKITNIGQPGIGRVPVGAFNRPDAEVSRFVWSSDGRYIAFETVDRTDVRRVPIPSYLHGEEPFLHEVRRPYPGDRDTVRKIVIFDTETGSTIDLDLALPRQRLFHGFSWAPDRPELLIHQGSDVGEDRWLRIADAKTGEVRKLLHDHRPRRIYPIFSAMWSADGKHAVFLGDSDDYYRLYAIDADGGSAEILTTGIWHFTGFDQHLTRRPDTHPEIFADGSLLDLGEDLADPLLIIHGMHDDIVPYKTTLMMAEKLMMLGKDFDLISMPNAPHWWAKPEHYGIYTFGKLEDFFRRHVPPGPKPVPGQEIAP
jgi:dipeptidyl-peptidase 4